MGHRVASTTIANVLKANGIKPAPDRSSSWRAFLKAHWGQIAGIDFFTTEVWTPLGLKTRYVLFVIDLRTRRVLGRDEMYFGEGEIVHRVVRGRGSFDH